jgi:hypothetical protein
MNTNDSAFTDRWLQNAGKATLETQMTAPRGLTERLRYVAEIMVAMDNAPQGSLLAYRKDRAQVITAAIGDKLIVGREVPCGLVVDDAKLSHRHFGIDRSEGKEVIRDLGSRNGTYVNGEKIREHELRDGDIIEAGSSVFVFLRQVETVGFQVSL